MTAPSKPPFKPGLLALALVAGLGLPGAMAAEVNVYSARHYDSDRDLYDGFREATGIRVNVIEAGGDALIARMKAEGRNSPADVFLTVDAGNLWRAQSEGLFQPAHSRLLSERIPAHLRHPEDYWFGFSTRARAIFVNPAKIDPARVASYADLADPGLKGQLCMRTSGAIYNLSLMGALIERWGVEKAEAWAKGVVANFAREPQGNDTSQLKSVASGECGATIANHYYFIRLGASNDEGDRAAADALRLVWPDQGGQGTHLNISGGGVLASAPHRAEAVAFLEYLAGDAAQAIVSEGNYEFPAVAAVPRPPALAALGPFEADTVNVAVYGENQARAQEIYDRAGWR